MMWLMSGKYDVRPIDDWVRMFAIVPLEVPADSDGAIVRTCHSKARGTDYLYCFRCAVSSCAHVSAVEDLGYKLEEL
jgi:hypothetical protein